MKRKIAMMLSMLLLACPAQMTAAAEEVQSTPGYIPEGLPVADDTIEYVDEETTALLYSMRDRLRENVYANFPNTKVHAVMASNLVGNVYVGYTSDKQAELDAAKAYCEANSFDMSLMHFYLYDESQIVPENAESSTAMPGDINGDHDVDIMDIIRLQKYILNIGTLTPEEMKAADLNQDNETDIYDLALMKRMIVNETAIERQWDEKTIDEQFLSFQENECEFVTRLNAWHRISSASSINTQTIIM